MVWYRDRGIIQHVHSDTPMITDGAEHPAAIAGGYRVNTSTTMRLIRENYSNVVTLDSKVVRAERTFNSSSIAISYFDFSEIINGPQFDLTEYIQEIIADDFYKNEGSLQWNYYLYFVLRSRSTIGF